jgi:hypothetical protein
MRKEICVPHLPNVHFGTKLPMRDVRSVVAISGRAEDIFARFERLNAGFRPGALVVEHPLR